MHVFPVSPVAHTFVHAWRHTDKNTQALVQSYYYLCRHSFSDIFSNSLLGYLLCTCEYICMCVCVCVNSGTGKSIAFFAVCIILFWQGQDCLHSKEWRLLDMIIFVNPIILNKILEFGVLYLGICLCLCYFLPLYC